MQVVFDTKTLAAAKRRQAWRDAICEIYLQVDCTAEPNDDYDGFVFLSEAADRVDERLLTRAHGRCGPLQRGRQIGWAFHALAVPAVCRFHLLEAAWSSL